MATKRSRSLFNFKNDPNEDSSTGISYEEYTNNMFKAMKDFGSTCDHELCHKIVIVNDIPATATKKEFKEHFAKFGQIRFVRFVYKDKNKTQISKAHIEYPDVQTSFKVITAPKKELFFCGSYLEPHLKCTLTSKQNKNLEDSKENGGNEDKCVFDDLSDKALSRILSFLPFDERIRSERVCKRWQNLTKNNAWTDNQVLTLKPRFFKKESKVLTEDILVSILSRCGATLRELNLASCKHTQSQDFPVKIAQYCPNLESVNLSRIPVTKPALKSLLDGCKNLNSINVRECSGINEESLRMILTTVNNLKFLNVSKNAEITGECFNLVKDTLKTLILNDCKGLSSNGFVHLKNSKIASLHLNNCSTLKSTTLIAVIKSLKPTLTKLHLGGSFAKCTKRTFSDVLKHCLNLTHLKLTKNPLVDDELVSRIPARCPQLAHLDIGKNYELTDDSIYNLSKLSHLRSLSLNHLDDISEDSLTTVSRKGLLERVRVRDCVVIGDDGCIELMKNCPRLKFLDVSNCIFATDELVDAACALKRASTSNVKLVITAVGSRVSRSVDNDHLRVKPGYTYQGNPLPIFRQTDSEDDSCESDDD